MLVEILGDWLGRAGFNARWSALVSEVAALVALAVCAWIANWVAKRVILRLVASVIQRTALRWDDVFLRTGVFSRLSHVAPALVLTLLGEAFFTRQGAWVAVLHTAVNVYLVVILLLVIDATLDAVVEIYNQKSSMRGVPLKGFTQGAKLVTFLLGGVFILSLVLGRSPLYLLSGLGALTAVLLLIFKDALLGLVAGVQLSVNRVVQIGDWIEMPKYGADGFVIDVSLTTVKVQNWDKTISSVPTYALISDPVKNWRGMQESGGRRIKRAIHLDMASFCFVDAALLDKLRTFRRLAPYLEQKLEEIKEWNEREGQGTLVNQRRLTNVGCYRAYVNAYLKTHPKIHQQMTLLVRQLAPSDRGLPLEIYAFTADTRWSEYEGIQSDVFDHLLTILPEFGLRVFQSPTGHDMQAIGGSLAAESVRESAARPRAPAASKS